ncbi:MAG: hypothetical protein FJ304_23530 [Planctomycetes bacterium]|nr:hypothetical protein [Planctomycetota bacterium]
MSEPKPQPRLIHVRKPLVRVEMNMEPVEPLDGPVTRGPLIRVSRPLKRVTLTFAPAASVRLTLPLVGGADGERTFEKLAAIIRIVNEMEALWNRAGVWVDGARSGVQGGEVVIVLVPNDTADALATCKRIAHILFNASPGATVKVFAAESEAPVYELAA